jgi:ketopantoate reductase
MKRPVVIVGMGEMGELFASGLLKSGHPVYPVIRGMAMDSMASALPDPELVLVAVGENELHSVLESLPDEWRGRLGLLQNELLPRDWRRHGITEPTVIVVWFDKKKGRPFVAVQPTPVCGPKASLITGALDALKVPNWEISANELLYELVRKNLYILTINIAGLKTGGTVGELWGKHRGLAERVANEILDIQESLAECPLPRARLMAGMVEGFDGDPNHICTGRSAPERLHRALKLAQGAGIATPMLQEIADEFTTQGIHSQ